MHEAFRATVESLVPSLESLLAMPPIRGDRFPLQRKRSEKIAGVYLFSQGGHPLYVGRSNDIVGRYYAHRRISSADRVAPFAFRLASETSKRTATSYKKGHPDSRGMKMADPTFLDYFKVAKEQIRSMDFRYVLEADPVRQAVLEVYCAVALGTPHNTFDNH